MQTVTDSYQQRNITVISVCGGGNKGNQKPCPHVQKAALEAKDHVPGIAKFNNSHYIEIPEDLITDDDWGCIGHRNEKGQTKIAQYLAPRISALMGW
jgi:hypothetical protein